MSLKQIPSIANIKKAAAGVLKSGILIFSSDEKARVSYEVKVYRRYFDYLYYLKRLQDSFLHSVAERGII